VFVVVIIIVITDKVISIVSTIRAGQSLDRIPFTKALGPSQSPIPWVPEFFPGGG